MAAISKHVRASLFKRMGTMTHLSSPAICPTGVAAPDVSTIAGKKEHTTAIERRDPLWNAVGLLDPACFRTFKTYGGNFDDALAFLYKSVVLPCATFDDHEEVVMVDDGDISGKKALDEAVAAINARKPPGLFFDADQFASDKKADIERVTAK